MRAHILDASALLAALRSEPGADVVEASFDNAMIGAANLAEVAGALVRFGNPEGTVRSILGSLQLEICSVDEGIALDAGLMRAATDAYGLSLGDRLCLATARRLDLPVITADRIWQEAAGTLGCEVILIR